MQVNEWSACLIAKQYVENQEKALWKTMDKEDLRQILKGIGGDGRGLKTPQHFCKKILKIIQEKCDCIVI